MSSSAMILDPPPSPLSEPPALAARLQAATRTLHAEVERSALMRRLLGGRLDRHDYAALLRCLQAIYRSLEDALVRHAQHACIAPVFDPALFRGAALADDLRAIAARPPAGEWLLPAAARRYAKRLESIAESDPSLLVAHAYVRYLGDLSGGQLLRRIVAERLDLPAAVRFYDFGPPECVEALKRRFRRGLDRVPGGPSLHAGIVAEAVLAFEGHRALFEELEAIGDRGT